MSSHAFPSPQGITSLYDDYENYTYSTALDTVTNLTPTTVAATSKTITLVLCVKVTAALSIFGSTWIAQEVLRDRKKRNILYHRLLLAFSISDISASLCMFIGSWAIQKGTDGIFMARGNHTTCRIQGMFIQLSVMTPILNLCLSIYYLLSIKYGYKERKLKKIEPYFYGVTLFWGFGTSITGLVTDSYSNALLWCWFDRSKERFRFGFFYGPTWVCFFLILCIMVTIYIHIRNGEKAVEKYSFEALKKRNLQNLDIFHQQAHREMEKRKTRHSKKVAIQSFYYVGAFVLAYLFPTLTRVVEMFGIKPPYFVLLLFSILGPMQGFMNFCVYMRPKLLIYYEKKNRNRNETTFKYNISGYEQGGDKRRKKSCVSPTNMASIATTNRGSFCKKNNNNDKETKPDNEGIQKNIQQENYSTKKKCFVNEVTEKTSLQKGLTKPETFVREMELVSHKEIPLIKEESIKYHQQLIPFDLPYHEEDDNYLLMYFM